MNLIFRNQLNAESWSLIPFEALKKFLWSLIEALKKIHVKLNWFFKKIHQFNWSLKKNPFRISSIFPQLNSFSCSKVLLVLQFIHLNARKKTIEEKGKIKTTKTRSFSLPFLLCFGEKIKKWWTPLFFNLSSIFLFIPNKRKLLSLFYFSLLSFSLSYFSSTKHIVIVKSMNGNKGNLF